jgi:anti-sigma factor RsiW
MSDDLACWDVVELLTAYIDGALDEDTASTVERHLAACPGCNQYLRQLKVTIGRVGDVMDDGPPALPVEAAQELTAAFRATFGSAAEL